MQRTTTRATPSDISYKVAIVGNAGIGKTTLLQRFQLQRQKPDKYGEGTLYDGKYHSTLGVDYMAVTMQVRDLASPSRPDQPARVRLELHDTAGSERFGAMIGSYLRNCDAVLFAFACAPSQHDSSASDNYQQVLDSLEKLPTYWWPFVKKLLPEIGPMPPQEGDIAEDLQLAGSADRPVMLLVATQCDRFQKDREARANYCFQHQHDLQKAIRACCCPPPLPHTAAAAAHGQAPDPCTAIHWTSGHTGEGVADLFDTLVHQLWHRRSPADAWSTIPLADPGGGGGGGAAATATATIGQQRRHQRHRSASASTGYTNRHSTIRVTGKATADGLRIDRDDGPTCCSAAH